VFVDEAAEDGPALDPFLGEVSDGVVGPGRATAGHLDPGWRTLLTQRWSS
jgi:hypothetical protein